MGSSKDQPGDIMRNDQVTAFPAIRLAEKLLPSTPGELVLPQTQRALLIVWISFTPSAKRAVREMEIRPEEQKIPRLW